MATAKGGPGAPVAACGRRHCATCKRWRLLIDFSPRSWVDKAKTVVKYVQSDCHVCHSRKAKAHYAKLHPRYKRVRRDSSRAWKRRERRQNGVPEVGPRVVAHKKGGSVRREPFAQWIRDRIEEGMSIDEIAHRTTLDQRQIHTFLNGYDVSGKPVKGRGRRKVRQVDWISFETVDKACVNWGEPELAFELYPDHRL